jgi:CBS domain-containing protein
MKVKDIMSNDVAWCTPGTSIHQVARMMVDCDCGAIPVVSDRNSKRPVGIITDRDICCRLIAEGKNPLESTADAAMTHSIECARPDDDLRELEHLMEQKQVRRIPVVDDQGCLCGMVAQADLARNAPEHEVAEVLRDVSKPDYQAAYHH